MPFAENEGLDQPAQADRGLCCSLTESVDTVRYIDEQKMPRTDCTDVHADLYIRCPQKYKGPFRALRII